VHFLTIFESLGALFYCIGVIFYVSLQGYYARKWLAHTELDSYPTPSHKGKSVLIIVPVFNENPASFRVCLESIATLVNFGWLIHVRVVDDGSSNWDELKLIADEYSNNRPNWTIIRIETNGMKRRAQDTALQDWDGDFVFTTDSDTILDPEALLWLIHAMRNPTVGAVAGKVGVRNTDDSWLTRLLVERFRLMFDREKASQSWHRAVARCWGPISLYRWELLKDVWEKKYLSQTYKGKPCHFGDDLALTLLVLEKGYDVVYSTQAVANTDVPVRLFPYLNQQLRWHKPLFRDREMTFRMMRKQGKFMILDTITRTYLPLLLIVPVLAMLGHIIVGSGVGLDLILFGLMLATGALVVTVSIQGRLIDRIKFTLIYGSIHAFLLVPIRIWAWISLGNNQWGTRDSKK
jgi:cellulose synthase/poly-beta-1,6-N-acetylglucosamine synthase-like glycosyltransferase